MENEKAEIRQQEFYSKPREIHEISRVTKFRQITIPRTVTNILKINEGDKLYWIKTQKKPHADEVFNITIRVIHTKEGT